jgi:ribosome-binding protein aMBF1 (putative translation factor)
MSRGETKTKTVGEATARRRRAVSPVGTPAAAASRRRAARSPEYREIQARLKPYEDLARLVIKFRLEHGLTQKQLADRMGTSSTAISRIESGQHPTTLQTMKRLAEALGGRLLVGFEVEKSAGKTERELVTV